jgi:hypothetical protein
MLFQMHKLDMTKMENGKIFWIHESDDRKKM